MMLKEYEIRYNVKPVSQLDSYLKLEGMDPLYIRSTEKRKQKNSSLVRRAAERLFGKWIRHMEISRVPNLR